MKRKLLSPRLKRTMLAVPAAAMMLGAAHAQTTVGVNFQSFYYDSGTTPQTVGYGAGYQTTGFPVTARAFGVDAANWYNTDPLGSSTNANSLPGSIPITPSDTLFGNTSTVSGKGVGGSNTFAGTLTLSVFAPNTWQSGIGEQVAGWNPETVAPGNNEATWGYLDDGNSDNSAPYATVSGLAAKFPNGYMVATIAAGGGVKLYNDVDFSAGAESGTASYSTDYIANPISDGSATGGTVGVCAPANVFTDDTLYILPQPKTSGHKSVLAGFIITDKPVVAHTYPAASLVFDGDSFVLNATAIGLGTFSYQWQHSGTNIPSATFASYTNSAATAADAGNYQLIVTSSLYPSAPATGDVVTVSIVPTHPAQTATWDADTATTGAQDGSGIWNYVATNWWNGAGNDNWGKLDSAVFGVGVAGDYTVTLGSDVTASAITFNSGSYTIANSSGETLTLAGSNLITANVDATITAPLTTTNTLVKAGNGALTLSGVMTSASTFVTAGTLEVRAKNVDSSYIVTNGATLKIGYSTGGGYANTGLKLYGDGTAATTGLYLNGGTTYNVNGGVVVNGAPTTIRQYGSGLASFGTFDYNSNPGLSITAAASGSVLDANIQLVNKGYGMVVTTAAGANTATGDLVVNGPLNVSSSNNGQLRKRGNGSLLLNGVANPANNGVVVEAGSIICGVNDCFGTSSFVNVNSSGTLDLNGTSQTVGNSVLAGTIKMTINKGASPSNDVLTVTGSLTYGGNLTVTNLGGTLVSGDSFTLFNPASFSGSFASLTLPTLSYGLAWAWNPATATISVITHTPQNSIWDADTVTTGAQDGSGTWSNTGATWWNGAADDILYPIDSAIFGASGSGAYTVTLADSVIVNTMTFNSGAALYTINNSSGQTLSLSGGAITANTDATIAVPVSFANTLVKNGTGYLTISGALTGTNVLVNAGTLEVDAKAGGDANYVVTNGATLKIGYSTSGGYATSGLQIYGDGTAATTGLYLNGGTTYNVVAGVVVNGAPTTIRQYGSGLAAFGIFDYNKDPGLFITAAASGSVIDPNIQMVSIAYGMVVTTAAGANTATGDLVINGPLNVTSSGFIKRGSGSVLLNATATTANTKVSVQAGTVICGTDNCLGANANLVLSAGATLDLKTTSQTITNTPTLSGTGTLMVTINKGGSPANGSLTLQTGTMAYAGNLIVTNIGGTLASGDSFPIFSLPAGYSGGFASMTLPALSSGLVWQWNPASGVLAVVTHSPVTSIWDADTGTTGAQDGNGTWNLTGANWWNGAQDDYFYSVDTAVFGAGVTGTYTVTLGDSVTANAVSFNNGIYTLTNSAGQALILQGSPAITANADVTIAVPAAGNGATIINSGTLTLGGAGNLGGGTYAGAMTNNGAFVHNSSAAQTMNGVISGTGSVTQKSGGDLTLTAANTYAGGTTMAAATIRVATVDNTLGSGDITVTGSSTLATASGGGARTLTNAITVNAGQTLSLDGGYAALTLNGPISGSGTSILKLGNGTAILGGSSPNYGGVVNLTSAKDTLIVTGNLACGDVNFNSAAGETLSIPFGGSLTATNLNANYGGTNLISGTLTLWGTVKVAVNSTETMSGTGTINIGPAGTFGVQNYSTINYSGITLNDANNFTLGNNAQSGNFNQSSGTVNLTSTTSGQIRIGHWNAGAYTSTYALSGGTLNAASVFNVGWDGNAALQISGNGIANLTNGLALGASGHGAKTNSLILTSGTLNIGSLGITQNGSGPKTNNWGAGTIGSLAAWSSSVPATLTDAATGVIIDTTGGNITLSGELSGTGALNKAGTGTLTVSGINTYTGATTVSNGTLLVNGTLAAGSAVAVKTAGSLSGVGIIKGAVTNSGTFAPGTNGIGTLSVSNTLVLNAGGTTTLAIDRTSDTNTFGKVQGMTSVAFGGTLTVSSLGGTFQGGDAFQLFSAGSYSGNFTATNLPPLTGAVWNWNPVSGVLSVVTSGPSGPGYITNSISGNTLTLTWPAGQGWRLVSQTNSLSSGLNPSSAAWGTVPGVSDGSATITINRTNPTVFYQLVNP